MTSYSIGSYYNDKRHHAGLSIVEQQHLTVVGTSYVLSQYSNIERTYHRTNINDKIMSTMNGWVKTTSYKSNSPVTGVVFPVTLRWYVMDYTLGRRCMLNLLDTTERLLTCWPWGLCKIWATAASVSVFVIWDTHGSGKPWTTLAGVTGVTGVPLWKDIKHTQSMWTILEKVERFIQLYIKYNQIAYFHCIASILKTTAGLYVVLQIGRKHPLYPNGICPYLS